MVQRKWPVLFMKKSTSRVMVVAGVEAGVMGKKGVVFDNASCTASQQSIPISKE